MSTKSRAVSAKGVSEFKLYITRAIPVTAIITCADNTGAKTLRVVNVTRYHGRLKRVPAASVGDHITVVVKRGPPETQEANIRSRHHPTKVPSEESKWPENSIRG